MAKLGVVILAGAADEPTGSLDGRTPLEVARMPALRGLAAAGRVGAVRTVPEDEPACLEAALGSLFGLAGTPPAGGLLAAALGLAPGPGEIPWRADLVNVFDGRLFDPTSGDLKAAEAELLLAALSEALGAPGVRFCPGLRWRALLFLPEATRGTRTVPPASFVGDRTEERLPEGPGADLLRSVMERAGPVLVAHDVNTVRADLGENPASGLWLWGGGVAPRAPLLAEGTVAGVGAHPSFAGLMRAGGVTPAATGPEPEAVGRAAAAAVPEADLVVALAEEPLRAGRAGDAAAKVRALEAADREIVAPLAAALAAAGGRLLVLPSHGTSSARRRDIDGLVPFVLGAPGAAGAGEAAVSEAVAAEADLRIEKAPELMEYAARGR